MLRGIKYVSHADHSGYARAAFGYMRALLDAGVPITWTPMIPGKAWGMWLQPDFECRSRHPEFSPLCNAPIPYDAIIVHTLPHYYSRWRGVEGSAAKLVGMTVWETQVLPQQWQELYQPTDAVLAPCRWNRDVLIESGVRVPVGVAPHVPEFPPPDITPLALPPDQVRPGDFVFYSIGMWTERKGLHLTLEAYLRAFTAEDPVVLVIKTTKENFRSHRWGRLWYHIIRRINDTRRDVVRMRKRHANPPRVVLLTEKFAERQIWELHARGDCFVSLTRAEGWGMGAYEAAVAGNPVIITGHGGQLDFLPEDLAGLVDFKLVPARPEGDMERESYTSEHLWAEPDIAHASRLLRHVFEDRPAARRRGQGLAAHIREKFAPQAIAGSMINFIEQVRPQ